MGKARFAAGGAWRAFRTQVEPQFISSANDIGTLGGTSSEAWDINDAAGVVGWAQNSSGARKAFWITEDDPGLDPSNQLPSLAGSSNPANPSEAYGINQQALVVGRARNDAGHWRAFIWSPGQSSLTDLNTIPAVVGTGWTLTYARAISDTGGIIGYGIRNGVAKSWILYPQCQD